MRAGDTLYLPRGWLHQAMTSDTASLHLTVGINVTTWRDAVRAAVDEAAEDDVLFRRGVGADGAAPEGLAEALVARLTPEAVGAVSAARSSRAAGRFAVTRSTSFARSRISIPGASSSAGKRSSPTSTSTTVRRGSPSKDRS